MGGQDHPELMLLGLFQNDPEPIGLEAPALAVAADADPLNLKNIFGETQPFMLTLGAVAETEGAVKKHHIETEEADHRPGPHENEGRTHDQAQGPEHRYQHMKSSRRQAAMGVENGIEEDGRIAHGKEDSVTPGIS